MAVRLTLSALLIFLSPGLAPYEALAAVSRDSGKSAPPKIAVPAIPPLPVSVVGAAAGSHAAFGAQGAAKSEAAAPVTTQQALGQAVSKIESPSGVDAGAAEVLEQLYTGGGFVGSAESVIGAPMSVETRLSLAGLPELAAQARDAKAGLKDRQAAVKAIADRSSDPARLLLEEIGSEIGGGSVDYEVKRLALRRLAEQGKVVSLPAVSEAHAGEILATLRDVKPDALGVDIDGTLVEKSATLTAEAGAWLAAASRAVPATAVITDRPAFSREEGEKGAVEAVTPHDPAVRSRVAVAAHRGALLLRFEAEGPVAGVVHSEAWTQEQQAAIAAAVDAVLKDAGAAPAGRRAVGAYDAFKILPKELTDAQISALDAKLKAAVSGLGTASVKRARFLLEGPYLTVNKYDKGFGLRNLLAARHKLAAFQDAESLPGFLRPLGRWWAERRTKTAAAGGTTLAIGDQFFGARAADAAMALSEPGHLAVSVSGTADPRLDNVVVWPTQGPAGAKQLLEAVAAKPNTNVTALTGFFSQRTLGMAVYFPTTVAFAALSIPILGFPLFAALMAFGSIVGIAMGPLNGLLARKFSPRAALMISQGLRAVLHFGVIALWAGGLLNFGTLLLAAAVNGWILTSIVTVDGITTRKLSGPLFNTMNALAWMNFLVVQVAMGILIGFKPFIQYFQNLAASFGYAIPNGEPALMIPYAVSVFAHLFVMVPIIFFTIPGGRDQAAPSAAPAALQPAFGARAAGFIRKYWLQAGAFAAALYAFFVPVVGVMFHQPIPVVAALVWWISRTDDFKALWANVKARNAMLMGSLAAALYYPLQFLLVPKIAEQLGGAAGKEQFMGEILGALFFGQLIATAGQAKLPTVRVWLGGFFDTTLVLKAAVVGIAGLWSYMLLFPASLPAALLVGAAVGGLLWLTGRYMNAGLWARWLGLGFAALALPWLLPASAAAAFVGILAAGLFYGPASVAMSNQFYGNVPKGETERMVAANGSVFNAAIALGFSVVTLLSNWRGADYSGLMGDATKIFIAVGVVFALLAAKALPGLYPKKEEKK